MNFAGRFAGRRAVVTGGASGIGLAVARPAWSPRAARVVPLGPRPGRTRPAPSVNSARCRHHARRHRLGRGRGAAKTTAERLGGIDVLVASAGITGAEHDAVGLSGRRLAPGDRRQPQRPLLLQPRGRPAHAGERLWPHRQRRLDRRQGRQPQRLGLRPSKAAVIGLTKSLGKELAKTASPSTPSPRRRWRRAILDQMPQEHIDYMLSKIPMGRFGKVDEIAAMICWLASEECSFTTGACSTPRAAGRPTDRSALFGLTGGASYAPPLPFSVGWDFCSSWIVAVSTRLSPSRSTVRATGWPTRFRPT